MLYVTEGKTFKLWATPARDPLRRARNKVLRAVHSWALKNGHAQAELDFGGAILLQKRLQIRVRSGATWTHVQPGFISDEQVYQAIKDYEDELAAGLHCPQPISVFGCRRYP